MGASPLFETFLRPCMLLYINPKGNHAALGARNASIIKSMFINLLCAVSKLFPIQEITSMNPFGICRRKILGFMPNFCKFLAAKTSSQSSLVLTSKLAMSIDFFVLNEFVS